MKTLVTGGAGFIGSHLVDELLNNGHEVTVLDNFSTGRIENLSHVSSRIDLCTCDISKGGDWELKMNGIDWVFHLAALADIVPSIQHPTEYFNSNVLGTFNMLRVSKDASVSRFVYAASSSCYGVPEIYPTPESAPINPQYPYALTKSLGEQLVIHWAKVYKLPANATRFFNVYGTRSRTSGTYGAVLGVFLAQKLAGQPFTVVGDGLQTRDFTYVSDIVDALVSVAECPKVGHIYNVGSGKTVSINRLVELLGGDKVHIPKRPGEPDITFADITAISKDLGWFPKVDIETGIAKVLNDIDYWRDAPVWTIGTIESATKDWFKYLGSDVRTN